MCKGFARCLPTAHIRAGYTNMIASIQFIKLPKEHVDRGYKPLLKRHSPRGILDDKQHIQTIVVQVVGADPIATRKGMDNLLRGGPRWNGTAFGWASREGCHPIGTAGCEGIRIAGYQSNEKKERGCPGPC